MTRAQKLANLGACPEAVEWVAAKGTRTDARIWKECDRPQWMLWLLGHLAGPPHSRSHKRLVACAAECAATAIPHVKDKAARSALSDVATRLKRYSESEAAGTAADAELNSIAAAYAAAYAADAAAYAADAAARSKARAAMAIIVRRHYPKPPRLP